MSDTEFERVEESQKKEDEKSKDEGVNSADSGTKTDDEWELVDPETEEKQEKSPIESVTEGEKDETADEKQNDNEEVMESVEDVIGKNLEEKEQSEPIVKDLETGIDEKAKEADIDDEAMTTNDNNDDATKKSFADSEPTEEVEKSGEAEPVEIKALDVELDKNQEDTKEDIKEDTKEDTEKEEKQEEEKEEEKIEMTPNEDSALPSVGDVNLLQSELLMERVKLRKRIGGATGRRPPTKRASWTDGQGRPISWMFADSAEPKLVDQEFSTDEEDEKEKEEEIQTPPKARVPVGGIPSPMMLPGLADAVKFRKKSPARHAREFGHTASRTQDNTEVKSPPWAKNILKSPPVDSGVKVNGLSPSWASGSALKQAKPAKDIPDKRPKPVVRPRPKPRPKSIAVMSDIQGQQPVVLSQELLKKVERQSLKQNDAEKSVIETENKSEEKILKETDSKNEEKIVNRSVNNDEDKNLNEPKNKMENKQNNRPTVSILIKTPSVEEKTQSPSPVLEKKINSDIINAQKKMEDKKEKEGISKTPHWMDPKKKLPPIPKSKPKPATRPSKPDKPSLSSSSSQPQWKQDLMKKKKEEEAQGKKKQVIGPQRKPNPNAPVITTLPDWQQDLAEKLQNKKKQEKAANEKGDEEKNEKEKSKDNVPEWKRQAAERAQRRKKLENANPPSNRPSHVDELPHPDETPNWKKQLEEKKDPAIDREIIVIKTVANDSDNVVENNKEQSENIPQWKKELMERKQRTRSIGDGEQVNKKLHIAEIIPKDSSAVPSWKAELEKRKQARLEKTYKSIDKVEETF